MCRSTMFVVVALTVLPAAVSAVAPVAWYVSNAKILGANYGAMVVLPLANASIEAPVPSVRLE